MTKISNVFEQGKALGAFVPCGDPDLETTAAVIRSAAEKGADFIQLGIPFSDPTAEGPLLQASSLRALAGGLTTEKVLAFVRELRRDVDVPIIFVTYANVPFSYGAERFVAACRELAVEGLLILDLPFEEKEEFLPLCRRYGVKLLSQLAPAPEGRIVQIAREAEGFLPLVPGPGETDFASLAQKARVNSALPCVLSVEGSSVEEVKALASLADGILLSTALVELLGRFGKDAPPYVGDLVREIKSAIS